MMYPPSRIGRSFPALLLMLALAGCAGRLPATSTPGAGLRTIILVRHGAYDESDKSDEYVGRALTSAGREQACLTGKRLADMPRRIDEVYVSPIYRARQTAEIICKELPSTRPVIDEDLAEGPPPASAATRPASKVELACRDRFERAYVRYFHATPDHDSTVLLVCHGNVIRWLWSRALDIDPGIWKRYQTSNCNVTEIRYKADGTVIGVSYNDVGHLPPRLRSFSWRSPMYPEAK